MKIEYHKWFTEYLEREFEILVCGHSGYPVLMFPEAKGRYYQLKDEGIIESLASQINSGSIKVYCVDSVDADSWYNWGLEPGDRIKTHNGYENVILNDVIEYIKYDTGRERIAMAGFGLGGYHSANLAFRHPDKASHIISLSGIFDIKQFIYGYYDDNAYFNNPVDYLPNLSDEWYLSRIREMGILLATGQYDTSLEENMRLSDILSLKQINHWLDINRNAGYGFEHWRSVISHYIGKMIY